MTKTKAKTKRRTPPQWKDEPDRPGWYVVFQRGRGIDVLFWGGVDCPVFEKFSTDSLYFGPFRLPFAV
jgi:hypothetical protein